MKRIVIKIGSGILTQTNGSLDKLTISNLAKDICLIKKENEIEVVIVTSGAVSVGSATVNLDNTKIEKEAIDYSEYILKEQILASVGQPIVISAWLDECKKNGVKCAQLLTTRTDFALRNNYLSIRSVVANLLKLGVIPIFNENDVLSPNRLDFTDNDQQACMIAAMVSADKLIILSDVDGVYDGPPNNQESKIIKTIQKATDFIEHVEMDSGSGKGGMKSKLMAADLATSMGIDTHIANGKTPFIISQVLNDNNNHGTYFPSHVKKGKLKPIKSWLTASATSQGKITVSTYLADILKNKKVVSVLLAGIEACSDTFNEGEIVDIYDDHNNKLARGIVRFNAKKLKEKIIDYKKTAKNNNPIKKSDTETIIHYDYLIYY